MRSFRPRHRFAASPPALTRVLSGGLALALACAPFRAVHAGDILRGGGVTGPARGPAISGANGATPNDVGAVGRDTLARTTQALQAVKAMQDAARNAAINGPNNLGLNPNQPGVQLPNVLNGLTIGGLQVAPKVPINLSVPAAGEDPSLWQGASLPVQTTASNGRTQVTITQNKQQALLDWQTFNVGKGTNVTFDQTAGGENASQWIAFNKINDPSGVPSQILGSIDAVGQIYLINQNGIIFGGSSQINLHTLVASSLPINDNLIARGLLNNPDYQFLFSTLPMPAGSSGTPAFTPPAPPPTPNGRLGDVIVQPGALLTSPTNADKVGGRIALFGPNVRNDGTISTPDGQAILAGGLQVGLVGHSSSDPSLRGLDVFVGAVDEFSGAATNTGLIDAPRANVTIRGREVNQLGGIASSTSVSLNGSINLLADYNATAAVVNLVQLPFIPSATGTLTLGPKSVTQILPEIASSERAIGVQLALTSQITLEGLALHLATDSTLLAPSATVALRAGTFLDSGQGNVFVASQGQVYLDAGARIDVSGSQDVAASVADNIVSAQLRGAELANSPLQRDGPLRGQTIQVDVRQTGIYNGVAFIGTPLADISGYANLVQRSVGELTANGGTVAITAGESVILQPGAGINVSGGWINYAGAEVATTKVISAGNIFDISQATPDRIYQGIYRGFTETNLKFGISSTTTSTLIDGAQFQPGYVFGGDGGSVSITAPSMALDGTLLGKTFAGPRQRVIPPAPSDLSLVFQGRNPNVRDFLPISPNPPQVIFQPNVVQPAADPFVLEASGNSRALRADRVATVFLSPDLINANGFGFFQLENSDGDILVPEEVSLNAGPRGSLTLAGANIDIRGSLLAPGGTLSFRAFNFSPDGLLALQAAGGAQTPAPDPTRGLFSLSATALLSTAGLLVDDRLTSPSAGRQALVTDGGNISITSYSANLVAGSRIDASGGVALDAVGKQTFGNGGAIAISAGQDPNILSLLGGTLTLDSALTSYSGRIGGSLNLLAPLVQIGGATANSKTLLLAPDFFNRGGFTNFTIRGLGMVDATGATLPAVMIAPGTQISPTALTLTLPVPLGEEISLTPTFAPEGIRAPVSLNFNAVGVIDSFNQQLLVRGDLLVGAGSSLQVDARGNVSLGGNTVAALGSVSAPGGRITITGARRFPTLDADPANALATVDLGPASFFSTAGTMVLNLDARGFRTGFVTPGGTISVSGNVVAEAGSVLDVSGTIGVLDLAPGFSQLAPLTSPSTLPLIPTTVETNAGAIVFAGGQEFFVESTLRGFAGGPSALGGSLQISSDRFYRLTEIPDPRDGTLLVRQSGPNIASAFYAPGETAIGHVVLGANGQPLLGRGYFAADTLNRSGLEALTLDGTVEFSGSVTIDLARTISVASRGVLLADAAVNLTAPYVKLGQPFLPPQQPQQEEAPFFKLTEVGGPLQPFTFAPTHGAGSLTVTADLIDLGLLSLQKIGRANFIATNGDIRASGTFDIAGDVNLTAGQVYTPTASRFNLIAYDYLSNGLTFPGIVTLTAAGVRQLPLSAGGEVNIFSTIINQGGTLRAPIGTINLGRDGTGPALLVDPIAGSTLPLPVTLQLKLEPGSITSVSAIDPATGQALIIPYGLSLDGNSFIDPSGLDITASGVPGKRINLSAANVATQEGSTIDLNGGGDLYAFRFVPGLGGSADILAANSSFAVIPGYSADYAPFAPFNSSSFAPNLGSFSGYVNSNLTVGDRVYLNGSGNLPAGVYTLLPARYALLPGAVLVTPRSGTPAGSALQPDGSTVVSGYRFNDLSAGRTGQPLLASFEVAPSKVVRARAQYDDFFANTFLRERALALDINVARLPVDAGQAVLTATQALRLQGAVNSQTPTGGRGGLIDISSPVDILIGGANTVAPAGVLLLDAAQLSGFNAQSLLIGGLRSDAVASTALDPEQPGSAIPATAISVTTNNLTLDNVGSALTGSDVILVANDSLTLAPNAEITSSGSATGPAELLSLGDGDLVRSGDGTLVRVSNGLAPIERLGVSESTVPHLIIGAGVRLTGNSVTIDSTFATAFDSSALLLGDAVFLNSGQISLQLNEPGRLRPTEGLVLTAGTLAGLQDTAKTLSFLSYSSIDIYGAGQLGGFDSDDRPVIENLALHAAEIRGFNNRGGTFAFAARNITLDNQPGRPALGSVRGASGSLLLYGETIQLGENQVDVDQFYDLTLVASAGIRVQETGGLTMNGTLTVNAPIVTGGAAADYRLAASGALVLQNRGTAGSTITPALGARLVLEGASVETASDIVLPSGLLTLHATSGDVLVRGNLDVSGSAQTFYDLTKVTDGGRIKLLSDFGNVDLSSGSTVNVAAAAAGGDAGTFSIAAPQGSFGLSGVVLGGGGAGGSFVLDVGSLPTIGSLNSVLNAAGISLARSIRVRTGDVLIDGLARAQTFDLSADQGSITVTGAINASGLTGGTINLLANGAIVLEAGSLLTTAAEDFNAAGRGGAISLETRGAGGAAIDLRSGSTIDLSVASIDATSAMYGHFSGTLHLRAPQTLASTDLQINPLNGTVRGASSILIEGYRVFDLTASGGQIDSAAQGAVRANGELFIGTAGTGSESYAAMRDRLLANNAGLNAVTVIAPGAELINRTGDLTLGNGFSDASSDWDLSGYRFGPQNAPGVLTLRATGNIVFLNALTDGFTSNSFTAPLLAYNMALPATAQSWAYRLTAGADLSATDFRATQSLNALAPNAGSFLLGRNGGLNLPSSTGPSAQTSSALTNLYQVVRTGTGAIEINAGRDVQLLNQFATIYTAGVRVPNATSIFAPNDFVVPIISNRPNQGVLGDGQQIYPPQWSLAGGDVIVRAGNNIEHLTRDFAGHLLPDSERQLPNNWLYRRGFVDPATGQFGIAGTTGGTSPVTDPAASTTWWIDFSNFFEGVGALGGGNVSLIAGHDISNVDAAAPTNARMPRGVPDASKLVELGGGNLLVRAGNDIDGGVYYVERGRGTLEAGNSIYTNSTRSPSLGLLVGFESPEIFDPSTWLPTTLFVGKSSFEVSARGDVLLGPVANTFLLPQGVNNKFYYKTYFDTYAPDAAVDVSSIGGDLTLRESATLPSSGNAQPLLQLWFQRELLLTVTGDTAGFYQPWLRLAETDVAPFVTVLRLLPPTLRATAFSGDINIAGDLILFPAARGTIELAASGAINALQPTGISNLLVRDQDTTAWRAARINLSDADPNALPGVATPFAYSLLVGLAVEARSTRNEFLNFIDVAFDESGSTTGEFGVLQRKQALHAAGILHLGDPNPARLYANTGDISGLTFFSAKAGRVIAGNDISDVGLYLQNIGANDLSLVAAAHDIVAYNANSPLRTAALAPGNALNTGETPQTGDIQTSGPGTLEVLAGRNLDLGTGGNNPDGTGVGLTSIGNGRNPALPFGGADIFGGAGIGPAAGLESSRLEFAKFVEMFVTSADGERYLAELSPTLTAATFATLSAAEQRRVALEVFYLALRDAGRDHNDPTSDGFGNYDAGLAAIASLFPGDKWDGNITTQARDIRTKNGGNISLFAPGGGLTLAATTIGNPLAPPGIITEAGGDIAIFTHESVSVGIARIFTLRGGNEIIWSSTGDIAAGASSKTVQSAPPTRVLIDPQSGDVQTDLAGLATGGGIGVLAAVAGVPPGDVDLIAPAGAIDAGDAGIRVSGNLNIAAVQVLNAGNISTGGASVGTPVVAAPNLSNLTAASNAAGAQTSTAGETGPRTTSEGQQALPSIITVEVLGYGGGDGDPDNTEDEEEKRRRLQQEQQAAPQGSKRPTPRVIATAKL